MTRGWFGRVVIGVGMLLGFAVAIAAQGPAVASYQEEEVAFTNGDVKLAGTLTVPSSGPPRAAIVLVTGSGAQNRDEELFGFRLFKVIADHFGKAGIAVLRYDDRGVGGSTGNILRSTTRAFAGDALAGLALVKTRLGASTPVGMLGHSEGALVVALAAAASRDVAFIIYMAGSGERGDAVLRRQTEDLSRTAPGHYRHRGLREQIGRGEPSLDVDAVVSGVC